MSLTNWVGRGTGTTKDKDEVNNREVCECEGWMWDLDAIGDPSKLIFVRKAATLVRVRPTLLCTCVRKVARRKVNWPPGCPELLKLQKIGQFPDEPVRIKFWQIHYVSGLTYYQQQTCMIPHSTACCCSQHDISLFCTCCLLWMNKAKAKDKIYMGCRCYERLQPNTKGIYAPHIHWVGCTLL